MTDATAETVIRSTTILKDAKALREAAERLQAESLVLRACGLWLDEKGETVDLTEEHVPIRDIRSIWIEANYRGRWIRLRRSQDPHFTADEVARVVIEIGF